MPISGFSEF